MRLTLSILLFSCLKIGIVEAELPAGGFLESKTPVLRTALVFGEGKGKNRTRRGVVVPVGHGTWACFDPDLLRWAAIWRAPENKPPLSYDSMAALTFPKGAAKAKRPPELQGNILLQSPELPGVSAGTKSMPDPRVSLLTDGVTPVGPLPKEFAIWKGISLRGRSPVIHYRVGDREIAEVIQATAKGEIHRVLELGQGVQPLVFRLGATKFRIKGEGVEVMGQELVVQPSKHRRLVTLSTGTGGAEAPLFPAASPAAPIDDRSQKIEHPAVKTDGPFSVRYISLPDGGRPIRPTDLAFLSDGTAMICTFDGDVWRVDGLDGDRSVWMRVATGLFESMAIAINSKDQVFVLGRDQITELIDNNGDGHIDVYRCASDAVLQTLNTRDFATSMEIMADGSFLVAKGGIVKKGRDPHHSRHGGSIVHISPDGVKAEVLADGLRMPFVGLRGDGAVFASDQQGTHVPSTPIHLISEKPFLGFVPANHRQLKKLTEPLLYYPYQANRSGAAFATTTSKAFSDLADVFLQLSWNGRLFGVATGDFGQPFSWQLPLQLDFPVLNGATHPKSGRLYVTGLGISGYKPSTPNTLGLASIEQSRPLPTPVGMAIHDDRIEVRFSRSITKNETVVPGSPALRLFNVKRTAKYGSGHYRWNGEAGEHHFQPKHFSLSADRRTVTLTFEAIRRSDILDLHLAVSSGDITVPLNLYARPAHLEVASQADLKRIATHGMAVEKLLPGDAAKGKKVFTQFACAGCHSLADIKLTGPPLNGIAARHDKVFLLESILKPEAKIAEGYPASMPSFEGVIPPQQLEDLLAYLLTLN